MCTMQNNVNTQRKSDQINKSESSANASSVNVALDVIIGFYENMSMMISYLFADFIYCYNCVFEKFVFESSIV